MTNYSVRTETVVRRIYSVASKDTTAPVVAEIIAAAQADQAFTGGDLAVKVVDGAVEFSFVMSSYNFTTEKIETGR